jgi:uncharacterized protein (DUF2236 family)
VDYDRISEFVSREPLERHLSSVRNAAVGSLAGIFGPQSIIWRIDREAAVFLGAGRALLLQLAHPWVTAAIEQHSNAFVNPIGRFHRTFSAVFTMVFGSLEQSLDAARHLHRRHADIGGSMPWAAGPFPAGSLYCANSLPALRWVHATLTDTALMAYTLVLPALTAEEREQYLAESRLFGALFGIPQTGLPESWAAFAAYMDATILSGELTVSDSARAMAHRLLAGTDLWFPIPASYRALTTGLLPPLLRQAFGLQFGEAERRAAENLVARIRWIYPLLPQSVRYVGPYQEAQQRLGGKNRPRFLTQICNRFWIGRAHMPLTKASVHE